MTALTRVRAALAAGERPSDDDVRAVCADADADALAEVCAASWSACAKLCRDTANNFHAHAYGRGAKYNKLRAEGALACATAIDAAREPK